MLIRFESIVSINRETNISGGIQLASKSGRTLALPIDSEWKQTLSIFLACLYEVFFASGSGSSTAVEHMPHNQEVIGSNPAELFSSLSILRSMFVFLVPLGGGAAQLIFLCNKCLAAHLVAKRGLWANNLQKNNASVLSNGATTA